MADHLDAPTIYRQGVPTLGVPVLSLDYRMTGGLPGVGGYNEPPSTPADPRWAQVDARLLALESLVAYLRLPWYIRLWRSLRGFFAAQRRHAPSPPPND